MKFGHQLPRQAIPEWASSYINYKGLKQLIKTASQAVKNGADADLAEFFYSLDRNLEDVDGFYNKKYSEATRRFKLLHGRYGQSVQAPDGMDKDEAEDLHGALLELRDQMRNLQSYGELNRSGFVKITKKLDKKIPRTCTQERYLKTKVDPKMFANNPLLMQQMKGVDEWIEKLGKAETFDDSGSSHSISSLSRMPARALNLASDLLDGADQAIRNNDASTLSQFLVQASANNDTAGAPFQQLLLKLLQRSISCKAKACIDRLLPDIESLDEEDDINKRNCIHRLLINIGRSNSGGVLGSKGSASQSSAGPANFIVPGRAAYRQPLAWTTSEDESNKLLSQNDESVRLLIYLLDRLQPRQRTALQSRDSYGRLPLHYAAQYGFVVICQAVIKHMQDWGQFDVTYGIDSTYWQDDEGYAPLHLSVIGGHPLTTKTLLQAENWRGETDEKMDSRKRIAKSGAVLALATQSNFVVIVKLLVEAGVDVNYQDEQGETALHVAARYGHDECAKALLEGSVAYKTEVDIPEKTFGWTPLFYACVDGHQSTAELLFYAGADLERCDNSGWIAKEHAALRGHIKIVERLIEIAPSSNLPSIPVARATSPKQTSSLDERRSKKLVKVPEPVKTFGHRYLTNETMVLVSLGTMDMRKDIPAVMLDDIPLADAHATQLDTALSVVVSASGATGEPTVIDLPVHDSICTEPITFMTTDASKVKLLFDIVPTYAGTTNRIFGRGVALLSSIKSSVGSKRINLQGDIKVPIIAANTLEVIGSVNFNFLIITPFSHPKMSITEHHTYWKKVSSTMVIGHRGLGKNVGTNRSLQLGENTIQSFIAAANLGATYVEFDVQLTKDHVPVIYHDFLVSETGIDAPVHTLTLDQFLHLSEGQTPRQSRPESPTDSRPLHTINDSTPSRRVRSHSMDHSNKKNAHTNHTIELMDRMKHTRDFKAKGYKGNSRGNFIQGPFTTLREMFHELPESAGFNIEMKYPMLHESEEHDMDQYAVELNSFVDTVLTTVYDLMGKRNIMFSSFNPDICLMLSFKQPSIPILFLTDAGTSPVGDVRAASLQEAIRFASRWNLLGIVSAAEPLVMCPRLVRVVKESGLVCVSYGSLNNDNANVLLQKAQGLDAVITDRVLEIRQGLTRSDDAANGVNNGVPTPPDSLAPNDDSASVSSQELDKREIGDVVNEVRI